MEFLVSILIPAFNAQQWIAETLRPAIAQTWRRKEIIVVNDGSTDQTLSVARRFESEGSALSHKRTKAQPQPGMRRSLSARAITFNGWMPIFSSLATRLPDRLRS